MIFLHHLASSGGTVFAKALTAQGNCILLNEVHPYFSAVADSVFSPTTVLDQYLARYGKDHSDADVTEVRAQHFRLQLQSIRALVGEDKRLLLREWSHGDFFAADHFCSSLLAMLGEEDCQSVVLLRHPVDCFLSGKTYHAWNPIKSDIDEFCRRYCKFCEFFVARPRALVLKYEDFIAAPDAFLAGLCGRLGLVFNPGYLRDLNQFRLSGASGRTSYEKIAPRPRRPMGDADRDGFRRSAHYVRACEFGGYNPGFS